MDFALSPRIRATQTPPIPSVRAWAARYDGAAGPVLDLTQAVPMLVAGAFAHAGFGEISIAVVVSLLIGQIPGVWIGARMSSRYDGHALRYLLMVILTATALKLLGISSLIAGMIALVGVVVVIVLIVRERIHAKTHVTAGHASG